jgi:hypothetical protein
LIFLVLLWLFPICWLAMASASVPTFIYLIALLAAVLIAVPLTFFIEPGVTTPGGLPLT